MNGNELENFTLVKVLDPTARKREFNLLNILVVNSSFGFFLKLKKKIIFT